MTDKAYIVANEQQEREVLEKLEQEGMLWRGGDEPTDYIPTKYSIIRFPYVLFSGNRITFYTLSRLEDEEIVYDGRKMEEERMGDKYVVSQEFMNELEEWKDNRVVVNFVNVADISYLPLTVNDWWLDDLPSKENNNRLIAIIRWVNGEDVFEVEKPKKWVVRSKEADEDGNYGYVFINLRNLALNTYHISNATRFDTKEEAESWANSHQEVVKVD